MKKKTTNRPVTKKQVIIGDILLIILGVVFFIFGVKDAIEFNNSNKVDDAAKFHHSYTYVSKDECNYKYVSVKNALKLLDDDAIIFVGKTTDTWSQVIARPLNDMYNEIYYLEIDEIKEDNNYSKLVSKLNVEKLTSPMVIVSNKSEIKVYTKSDLYDKEYDGIPLEYWTDERTNELKELLK